MSESTTTTILVRTDAADAVRYAVAAGSHPIRLDLSVWPERQRLWLAAHVRDTATGPRLLLRGEQPSILARNSAELLAWVEQQLLLDEAEQTAKAEKDRELAVKVAEAQAESARRLAERRSAHDALDALPIAILAEETVWTDEIRGWCDTLGVHCDSVSVCGALRRTDELSAWRHVQIGEMLARCGATPNQLARHAAHVLPHEEMCAVIRGAVLTPVLAAIGAGLGDVDVLDKGKPLSPGMELTAEQWDAYTMITSLPEVTGVRLEALLRHTWIENPDNHGQDVHSLEVWARVEWRAHGLTFEAARRFH